MVQEESQEDQQFEDNAEFGPDTGSDSDFDPVYQEEPEATFDQAPTNPNLDKLKAYEEGLKEQIKTALLDMFEGIRRKARWSQDELLEEPVPLYPGATMSLQQKKIYLLGMKLQGDTWVSIGQKLTDYKNTLPPGGPLPTNVKTLKSQLIDNLSLIPKLEFVLCKNSM